MFNNELCSFYNTYFYFFRKKLIHKRTCGNKNGNNHIIIINKAQYLNDEHMLIFM